MPRIIYSLTFDIRDPDTGEAFQLIAPLDSQGQSPHCAAEPPKQRVIDLRVGDKLRHQGKLYRVEGAAAFRDAQVAAEYLREVGAPPEGYVVRETRS